MNPCSFYLPVFFRTRIYRIDADASLGGRYCLPAQFTIYATKQPKTHNRQPIFIYFYLLIDRNDDVIDICEMKYYADEFVMDENEANRINNRILRLREETGTDKAIHALLVTTKGLKRNAYSDVIQAVVTMPDLFKE